MNAAKLNTKSNKHTRNPIDKSNYIVCEKVTETEVQGDHRS